MNVINSILNFLFDYLFFNKKTSFLIAFANSRLTKIKIFDKYDKRDNCQQLLRLL